MSWGLACTKGRRVRSEFRRMTYWLRQSTWGASGCIAGERLRKRVSSASQALRMGFAAVAIQ